MLGLNAAADDSNNAQRKTKDELIDMWLYLNDQKHPIRCGGIARGEICMHG